jgi:hypothetical protein
MDGKERMARAMWHEEPDRVPVMCQLALGHYFLNTSVPEIEIWHSTEGFGDALIELQSRYGFDGILINLPGRDPSWRSYVGSIEELQNQKVIHWKNGWHTICPRDDNPHVVRPDGTPNVVAFQDLNPEKLFYIEPHDLKGPVYPSYWGFAEEPAPINDFFPPWQFDTIDYVVGSVGRHVSVHGEVFSPFSQMLELLGCSNALVALADDAEKFEACLDALTLGTIALARGMAAHDVDAILISSAFAGAGFISPDHYRRFVLPFEKRVVHGIKAYCEIPVYTHTCGRIGDRLELMQETGTNGIDTLDPAPLGDVELADAKKRIGANLFLKGNLDPVNVLLKGTHDQVWDAAVRCIDAAAHNGGYVLSTACSVPPHTPVQNVGVLRGVAELFGRY